MSVDIIMYKIRPMTKDELLKIRHMNVNDLSETDGWEIKEYSFEEMSKNPARFDDIKDFMKTVELMHTQTDYRACCIANGMSEDTKSYCFQHFNWGCRVSFDGGRIEITREELDRFTTTNKKTYCVVKRECVDVDVDGWIARTLMTALEKVRAVDLSYAPILLNKETCEEICRALVDIYDADELFYTSAELGKFMIELMRAMYNQDDNIFIEFQD